MIYTNTVVYKSFIQLAMEQEWSLDFLLIPNHLYQHNNNEKFKTVIVENSIFPSIFHFY